MQFLKVIDAICDHNSDKCESKDKRDWSDGTVMGVDNQQQETEDQYKRREGIGSANELTQNRVSSLQDGRTENDIPAKCRNYHHNHQAVEHDARACASRDWLSR